MKKFKIKSGPKPGSVNRKRILIVFGAFVALFVVLALRTSWHAIIKGEEYAQKASKQQTEDSVITALRGNILDRDSHYLAISATANTIWARPSSIKSNGKTDEAIEENARQEAADIAEILNMDADEVYELITSNKSIVKIAKNVDGDTADKLRELDPYGVDIIESSKRYYPTSTFASHIVGITSDDNVGITGLEKYYNDVLSGTDGRWITSTDNNSNTLIFGNNKYYDAQDGYTIVTTIDSNIQRYIETKVSEYAETYDTDRTICIVMDPKTGEILGMAQDNKFDLNNPRTSAEGDEEYYLTLTESEQVEYWSNMWRNYCISDVFEPGSTLKPITAALALDYGVTNMNEWFYCNGYTDVEDWTIHCWNWPGIHGSEQLTDAIVNSCNQVMIELVSRLGRTNYYNGLRTFCITEKTGVDYPGEGTNIIYDESDAGPVELATMSFGQGIAVTPISLISAIGSLCNEGKLMTPHFVKEILDSDGNVVEEIEPTVRNITCSSETASNLLYMMEKVVTNGGATPALIPGYRVGGKTGTSYISRDGVYSDDVWTTFIGFAPADDPQFIVMVVMEAPNNQSSWIPAACVQSILKEILLQRNIQPDYTAEELAALNSNKATVPDVVGKSIDDATGIIMGYNFNYEISEDPGTGYHETVVTDQYPRAGVELEKGSTITIYYK